MHEQQIEQLIYEKRRRLQGLKLKEARFGLNTPPEVYTEIEDLKVEIESLEEKRAKIIESRQPVSPATVSQAASSKQKPDLIFTLAVEPERAPIGSEATWTVTVRNAGDDPLRHLTVIRGRTILDDDFELAAGEEQQFTFTTGAETIGRQTESVRVTGETGDGVSVRKKATATIEVFEPVVPSLALGLTVEPELVTAGDEVTWTVTVLNDGNDPLRSVIVRHGLLLLDDPFDLAVGDGRQFAFTTSPKTAGKKTETVTAGGMARSGDSVSDEAGATVQVRKPKAPKSKAVPKQTSKPASSAGARQPLVEVSEESSTSRPATRDEKAKILSANIVTQAAKTGILTLTNPFEMEFVHIPAGEFLMGSDPAKDKNADDNEQPQHTVDLPGYYIAKYPITKIQFATWKDAKKFSQNEATHPAVNVTWYDAVAFCHWLSEKSGHTVRLPTEAEWEKAARGTDGRIYPWGNSFSKTNLNCRESGLRKTTPVNQYSLGGSSYVGLGDSPYGVADMIGNIWEWCSTIWNRNAYPFQIQNEWTDAYLDEMNVFRVLRGGSWSDTRSNTRCAARLRLDPNRWSDFRGFRVVISPI